MRLTWAQPGIGTMGLSVEAPPCWRSHSSELCLAIKRQLIRRMANTVGAAGRWVAEAD